MLNDKYTVEGGRSIKRNGVPFVHIARSYNNGKENGYAFDATDADTFAHYAAAAPALIVAARAVLAEVQRGCLCGRCNTRAQAEALADVLDMIDAAEDR